MFPLRHTAVLQTKAQFQTRQKVRFILLPVCFYKWDNFKEEGDVFQPTRRPAAATILIRCYLC